MKTLTISRASATLFALHALRFLLTIPTAMFWQFSAWHARVVTRIENLKGGR